MRLHIWKFTPNLMLILTPFAFAGGSSPATAQDNQGGDHPVAEEAVDPAVAAAAEAARKALGVSAPVATGVGVFLTPSKTAPPSSAECQGDNCTKGFPSNVTPTPPPPPES